MNNLTPEQAEIIDLLRNEIAEMVESDSSAFQAEEPEPQQQRLRELQLELEHLANACELAGLFGLMDTSRHLAENYGQLQEQCPLSKSLSDFVLQWAVYFLGYLNYVGSAAKEGEHVSSILDFLDSNHWPIKLDTAKKDSLRLRYSESDLSTLNNKDNSLPTTATTEMSSLSPGDDVRADLLSGMLLELPEQVRVFETSINAFMESQSLDELSNARRMAHTLKGSANIVGVKGLANLMHFTEDLLEIAAKQSWADIPQGFVELLIDASDGLAQIAEYLTGVGEAPDNIIDIQQQVLNWVHAISEGKVPHATKTQHAPIDDDSDLDDSGSELELESLHAANHALRNANEQVPERVQLNNPINERMSGLDAEVDSILEEHPNTPSAPQKHVNTQADEEKHFINIPEASAHELLRIAGEVQIGNTQISAQVEAMKASMQHTDQYHKQIRTMAEELETLVQTQNALRSASLGYTEGEIDPLEMERFSELHTFSHRLLELTTDSYEAISNIETQIQELQNLAYAQGKLNEDSQNLLLEMRLVPVSVLSSRFNRCVRQACRLTGKAARLTITGDNVLMDSRVLNRIADPIMHLLRNAVDHGLEETADARQKVGKKSEGNIELIFRHVGETITIECKDDGRGLDYNRIHEIALRQRLITTNDKVDKSLLNQIILMAGFSTRESASQTSGRGIGLDAVMADVRSLKGSLKINSEEGKGCHTVINVPSSILSGHTVMIRSSGSEGDQILSLVSRSIEQIVHVTPREISHTSKGMHFLYEDNPIPVYNINDLTDIHRFHGEQMSALLILRKPDKKLVAVGVESILASENMVIKPLNDFCVHPPGVVGATILGNGTVSPVIDLLELPGMILSQEELATLRKQRQQIASLESQAKLVPPMALIVDDSLSARRSLAQFVSDMGIEVYTAKDGFEAISVLKEKKPAFMLVDLEMPRMNGLELTSHIRSREDTCNIPVIMITSRSTEKHRQMARSAGVNTYLNKPWSEEELMSTIHQQIA